jgi:hypothetical protein
MRTIYILVILVLLALAVPAAPAQAGGVVTVCDEAHLLAALAGGRTVTFACSGTISLTNIITIVADTTIDGSGQDVTISGNDTVAVLFIVNEGVTLSLNEVTIADGSSRGIENYGTLIVSNSTFSGNNQGIACLSGTLNVSDSTFTNNNNTSYNSDGGAIHVSYCTWTVSGSAFVDNHAINGGGISSGSFTTIGNLTNSTFAGNTANHGGGVQNNGTLTVSNSIFTGNSSERSGGGIENYGTLTVSDTIFSGNTAGSGIGGGICNVVGLASVTSSTFSGNTANHGGGIANTLVTFPPASGVLHVANSTFFDNSASYYGGGISSDIDLNVSTSTFAGNSAYWGGGIDSQYGTATLRNTIIANSPTGSNCFGTITDGGGNLSYPDATCPGINADPLLGPLQDNGGPTWTMALVEGSAAIDAADDAACAAPPVNNLDQRGFVRPWGAHCDIGAVEQMQEPVAVRLSAINAGSTPGAVAPTAVAGLLLLALGGCAAWGRRQTQQVG